ncbi:MAG: DUF190 domain-containing protein [Candidatus Bathyarchaeota archaeon]|nr:DUF190 domain-containing protein [Candidatus Bathyarchaeota archaeon]
MLLGVYTGPLYRYIVEYPKREGISGATILRGFMGFGTR